MLYNLDKNEERFVEIMTEIDKIRKRNDLTYKRHDNKYDDTDGDYMSKLNVDLMYAENLLALLQRKYEISEDEMEYQLDLAQRITGNMCKRYELYVSKRYELKPLMAIEKKGKKSSKK